LRRLAIERAIIRDVRNLERVQIEPSPQINVVYGANGQGKTNLLEALYLGATTRSFRTSQIRECVRAGASEGIVKIDVRDGETRRTQTLGFRAGLRAARVDDQRAGSLAEYAAQTPVVVFCPADVGLSMGPSKERRKLLDRMILYTMPARLGALERYTKALRARQHLLETRGPRAPGLDEWEALVVRFGLEVMDARREAAAPLAAATERAFAEIGSPEHRATVRYAPSAPVTEAAYAAKLRAGRERDARRKSSGVGPHRDDLEIEMAGRPARGFASQGQHRALALALKAAEMDVVSASRGARPILLLDDVSSELDRERARALLDFLDRQEGQVFLTTTRPEWVESSSRSRRDFDVVSGRFRVA
jgi:DNA replication and repair protein RecF